MENKTFSVAIAALNEEEHIESLIRSTFDQNYRPIEVIFVDDGSKDDTFAIVENLERELNQRKFRIRILKTKDFDIGRGPAAAWNIGLMNAEGEYFLYLPGDAVFTNKNALKNIRDGLEKSQIVSFTFLPKIDNQLEFNLSLDFNPREPPLHHAYRSSIIKKVMFDPTLGVGEDWDLPERMEKMKKVKKQTIVDTEIGFHWPHTYQEYASQRFWRGRTVWPLLKKHLNFEVLISRLLFPISTFVLFFLTLIFFSVEIIISLFFGILFILLVVYLFLKSPVKNMNRLFHLVFTRFIYGSFFWTIGAFFGFYQYFIIREFSPGKKP